MIILNASGQYTTMIFLIIMVLVFYFFMLRPQQRKQKRQRDFLKSMNKGDEVVTLGGIFGRICHIEDDNILLEVDRGIKIKVKKNFISYDNTKTN